ncbi:MAG: mftB [Chloroflexi bacterium]|jgi:putative mycofactocin binding protein MftB|nr:mftB [Chloroflexota bacterium]
MVCAASTDVVPRSPGRAPFRVDGAYRLSPSAALRPEQFGALAYHYGNRRLTFLKSPQLVSVVRALEAHATAQEAMDSVGVDSARRPDVERALAGLLELEVLDAR